MQELNKEDKFYQLMQKGRLYLHSDELENGIMQKILRRNLYKKRVYKNLKISISFLTAAIILGFASSILPNTIDFLSKDTFWLFQTILLLTFLFLVNYLIKYFKERNKFLPS